MADEPNSNVTDTVPVEEVTTSEPEAIAEVVSEKESIEAEEIVETATSQADTQVEGVYTIRSEETGDKVYAVREEKRYWIKNPETLAKMGFYIGKEKKIPFSELLNFPEGEPIDLTVPDAVYPWDKPEGEQPQINKSQSVWQ